MSDYAPAMQPEVLHSDRSHSFSHFILFTGVCIPESQQQQQNQLPTSWEYLPWNLNYCVKLLLSSLRFVFAKETCPTTTSREEKKKEKGLYITELTELLQ